MYEDSSIRCDFDEGHEGLHAHGNGVKWLAPIRDRSAQDIVDACTELRDMLLEKNASYGDSALAPRQLLSKATPTQGILMRIDDKLQRLIKGSEYGTEDTELDLLGYFLLLRIARLREKPAPPADSGPTKLRG